MRTEEISGQYLKIEFSHSAPAFAVQFFTPGVSDHTYLVISDGEAALVDPQRDYLRFLEVMDSHSATLTAVLETHIHNDYVSGGSLAAQSRGARYILPEGSGAKMPHEELTDGESLGLGQCRITAMHTPGHTPHHTSYVLECDGERLAVFTGGSMLIGGVGRTDLISPELTEPLARSQFRSVRRTAEEMPDPATVGPTHSGGSFCGTGESGETISTIEIEKTRNSALLAASEDEFVSELIAGYRLYPDYYTYMAPINVAGAPEGPPEMPQEASPQQLESLSHNHSLIDVRPRDDFAAAHVPGSVNIPDTGSAAVYAGWALPWDQPVVLISDSPEEARAAFAGFSRIGMDRITAVVTDGLAQWKSEGRTISSYQTEDFATFDRERPTVVVDARDPAEFAEAHIPGAVNIHFSRIRDELDQVPDGEVWVHCESGFRSAIAASILAAAGRRVVLVNDHISNSRLLRAAS